MAIFESGMFLGLGAVAIWLYVRFPGLRPRTMLQAVAHVAVSFFLFSFDPQAVRFCLSALPDRWAPLVFVVVALVPTLCYVFVSWVWLIAKLHDLGNSLPRGGHPARGAAS